MSDKYSEDEWLIAAGHLPLDGHDAEDLMLLHRHWIWANVLHDAHAKLLRDLPVDRESIETLSQMASTPNTLMFVFYGLLYSVIEAFVSPAEGRDIDLRGRFRDDIEHVSEKLRRCRNAIMHVPKSGEYFDKRIQDLIGTEGIVDAILRIHHGFGRLFYEELMRRKDGAATV